jgi:hypothetical protein
MLRILPLLVTLGCSLTDSTAPRIVGFEVTPAGPLVQTLSVNLERPSELEVEYWTDGVLPLRVRSPSATTHTLPLTRLRAGRPYQFEIGRSGERGSFFTEPLPDDLAAIRFNATGSSTLPMVLLHVTTDEGFRGYVIVDQSGAVVWYSRSEGFPYGMTRRQNGNFVFLDGVRGLREVTPWGEVVAELPQDSVNREMHHDVVVTPSNSVLALAFDTREWSGARLKGEAIWEWYPETRRAEKRWSSWDHLSPDRDRGPRFGLEWMHANSLAVGPRGNVLVSAHYFNQVFSIAPGWRAIEWRLGGVNATIAVGDGSRFSGQHTAAEVSPEHLILFDNGIERSGARYSRALQFDLAGGQARPVWEWRASPDNFAFAVSSARRLANGNTLVAFGMRAGLLGSVGGTEVYEVTFAGQPLWRLRVDGPSVMFRAEPIWSVGGEEDIGR